jgi:hypothetical protein
MSQGGEHVPCVAGRGVGAFSKKLPRLGAAVVLIASGPPVKRPPNGLLVDLCVRPAVRE